MSGHVLIILGMHRSGTTLTAEWLQQCGLHIGERLSYPWSPHPEGLYEDKDFIELHKKILCRNNATHLLKRPIRLQTDEEDRKQALALIEARRGFPNWGWKDPRTVLLLPFWHELLPSAQYLIVYRHYTQVVGSLHRRNRFRSLAVPAHYVRDERFDGDGGFSRRTMVRLYSHIVQHYPRQASWIRHYLVNPSRQLRGSFLNLPLTKLYARNWAYYNQAILDFYHGDPERCLCLSIGQILANSELLIEYLNQSWGFTLSPVPVTSVFDPRKFKQDEESWHTRLCEWLVPSIPKIYAELKAAEAETLWKLHGPQQRAR
jgi:hypothetical protein